MKNILKFGFVAAFILCIFSSGIIVYAQTDESVQEDAQASRNPLTGGGEFDAAKELEGEGWLRKVPVVGGWITDRILGESIKAETSDETKDLRSETGQQEWTYDNPFKRTLCRIRAIPCQPPRPPVAEKPKLSEKKSDPVDISAEALEKSKIELEKIKAEDRRKDWQAKQWFGCRNWGVGCPKYVPPKPEGTFDVAKIPDTDIEVPDDLRDAVSDNGKPEFTDAQKEFLDGFNRKFDDSEATWDRYIVNPIKKIRDTTGGFFGDIFGGELSDAEKESIRLKAEQEALQKYPRVPEDEDADPEIRMFEVIKEYVDECWVNPNRPECKQVPPPPKDPDDDDNLTEEDFLPPPPDDGEPLPPPDLSELESLYNDGIDASSGSSCPERVRFDTCYNSCGDKLNSCGGGGLTCQTNYNSCIASCGARPSCF